MFFFLLLFLWFFSLTLFFFKNKKQNKKVRNDVLYRQLIMSQLSAAKDREIRQDVTRTFPELPVYMQEKGKEALFRVLMAYSIYDSEVGYWYLRNFESFLCLYFGRRKKKHPIHIRISFDCFSSKALTPS